MRKCSDLLTFIGSFSQLGDLHSLPLRVHGHRDETLVLQEVQTPLDLLPQTLLGTQVPLLDVQQCRAQELSHLLQRGGDLQQKRVLNSHKAINEAVSKKKMLCQG